eukprot:355969-Chlamydomonas_euryale.AAC.2
MRGTGLGKLCKPVWTCGRAGDQCLEVLDKLRKQVWTCVWRSKAGDGRGEGERCKAGERAG